MIVEQQISLAIGMTVTLFNLFHPLPLTSSTNIQQEQTKNANTAHSNHSSQHLRDHAALTGLTEHAVHKANSVGLKHEQQGKLHITYTGTQLTQIVKPKLPTQTVKRYASTKLYRLKAHTVQCKHLAQPMRNFVEDLDRLTT